MYRLIIVDDEAAIRRGMCNYIPWNDMGFEVVADLEDGKETIEYLQDNDVDVIISDIEMAEITGLELSKYVYNERPNIKMVILSGYKVFEYARKAVEYNVEYYLLKPVNLDEVKEVFGKIKTDLDSQKTDEEFLLLKQKDFAKILLELQEQFFTSMLVGSFFSEEKVIEKSRILELDFKSQTPYALLDLKFGYLSDDEAIYIDNHDERQKLLHSMFGRKNEDIVYYVVSLSNGITKVIAASNCDISEDEFEKKLTSQIEDKCQVVEKLMQIKLEVAIENLFNSLDDFIKHKHTLQMHVEKDSKETKLVKEDYKRLIEKYKLLIEYISDGDFEALDGLIDNIFFEFRNLPLYHVKNLVIDMFSLLSTKFMKMGNGLWESVNEKVDYQEIMKKGSMDSLKVECKDLLKHAVSVLNSVQNDASKCIVNNAILYIKDNYGDDLSLDVIADKYFLSPAYFSRLFKQYTGSTFTEYLTNIRMEKAKEFLLLGKYKIYEISQMVGYNSEKYFFRVFKQYTGSAPTEYTRNVVLENE